MAEDKIKFDEETHNSLKEVLKSVKEKLSDVDANIKVLQTDISTNFEGDAATALSTALTNLQTDTSKKVEEWEKILTSSDNIAKSMKNADNSAKRTVEGH
jgi:hypothetical protein